jgi:hypothetical protein
VAEIVLPKKESIFSLQNQYLLFLVTARNHYFFVLIQYSLWKSNYFHAINTKSINPIILHRKIEVKKLVREGKRERDFIGNEAVYQLNSWRFCSWGILALEFPCSLRLRWSSIHVGSYHSIINNSCLLLWKIFVQLINKRG